MSHDRISSYSQLRLAIQLPANGGRCPWSLNLTQVTKGVPRARQIEDGHVVISSQLGTPEALHEVIALVARELSGRFPLILPGE